MALSALGRLVVAPAVPLLAAAKYTVPYKTTLLYQIRPPIFRTKFFKMFYAAKYDA
jgi:hypothetical protein